ncbi:MAG: sigma-54-dependent Fis family transcriptional regulator, partial [Candidatus Competibacteraceae bacterium]|nr:sigma-54-dependent Fis family transcriptional regulator [Candidatus Competibacteraceae bacterium]
MAENGLVLFIDDEKHLRMAGQQTLELAGCQVQCQEAAAPALAQLTPEWPGVVVCDIKMPHMDGLAFMEQALAVDRDLPIILITGHGDIAMAVKAMRNGAYDFIEKPFPAERLVDAVRRALEKRVLTLENRNLRRELETQDGPGSWLIGRSPAIQRLRRLVIQVAGMATDVLIVGETGTGKELVAHHLHEYSD